ncbi:endomucin isoform X2 [Pleurodeles waltl]|uniref:endomucin isoform X2 n=1 Tax=Pleurodeles waltl TaxID=8319 RepID=UPI0037097F94
MQPLGAAVLFLAVANIHWANTESVAEGSTAQPSLYTHVAGSTELIPVSENTPLSVRELATQTSQATNGQQPKETTVTTSSGLNNNATPQSTNASLIGTSVFNSTEAFGQGRTTSPESSNTIEHGGTEKITTVFTNTTGVPDSNFTLPLGRGSSSTASISNEHQGPTKIGILPELTTKFIDYSKATQPLQDSDLSSGPTPSMLEKTRYIAPAVMVPILLVGAVSFIVWKMCQSDPPGSDQNENPKYVSKTGSVQLLSVRTTTPQADVK